MIQNINLFENVIPLYGVLFFLGIFFSVLVGLLLIKKSKIAFFDFVACAIYAMIGAILGAKLLFVAVSLEEILRLQLSFITIVKSGFVFYGGLIGGFFGVIIYTKQFKLKSIKFLDCFATVLPLGHAFGRIGCFYSGCCYGIPYSGVFSHVYTNSNNYSTPIGIPLLPIQLIESSLLFVLFFMLLIIFIKCNIKGLPSLLYAICYSVMRFILEFFRGDTIRGIFLGFSTSQWISILIFIITIIFIIKQKKHTH